ncbi:MAG: prephenate dehydrogenase [Deltaproteobacteria bacterium]|nr:prephenate dehydrogenase [Deltaproteobacteria bacterium]
MSSQIRFPRFALLGVGYIGGSAALAGKRAGLLGRVVGYDLDSEATATALRNGVIDEPAASAEAAVREASLVLLAAPVGSLQGLLTDVAPGLAPDATVVDVGSVKSALLATAESGLTSGQFVGCHPMAGAEFVGVEAADAGIFSGRVCFLCPPRNARAEALAAARDFWAGIGCRIVAIEPELHDRLMAAQSHLPHVAAFALAAALAAELPFLDSTTQVASPTTSLRDTTRIAASGAAVWRDILLANASHVLPLVEQLRGRVEEIGRAVAAGDGAALDRVLLAGRACRQRLVKE